MRTPALDAWRRELAARERTKTTFDVLWRAACREATALEFAAIPQLAASCLADAKRIILAARRQQRQAAA